jgi:hypothetical protein
LIGDILRDDRPGLPIAEVDPAPERGVGVGVDLQRPSRFLGFDSCRAKALIQIISPFVSDVLTMRRSSVGRSGLALLFKT